jgi:hypothetical protein
MAKQINGRNRRQHAYESRQSDKSQIVFGGDAVVDLQHFSDTAVSETFPVAADASGNC